MCTIIWYRVGNSYRADMSWQRYHSRGAGLRLAECVVAGGGGAGCGACVSIACASPDSTGAESRDTPDIDVCVTTCTVQGWVARNVKRNEGNAFLVGMATRRFRSPLTFEIPLLRID